MGKRNRIVATYRLNADEFVQVVVDSANAYPEALAVARANARELVSEMLSDVLAQTRADEPAEVGSDE